MYRDQEFSSDLNSRPVKRIEDVRLLRARQFPEDAGPMAHPIRPVSCQEISNFYTLWAHAAAQRASVCMVLFTFSSTFTDD